MKLADEENVELTDEQLEFLASGGFIDSMPYFGKEELPEMTVSGIREVWAEFVCDAGAAS